MHANPPQVFSSGFLKLGLTTQPNLRLRVLSIRVYVVLRTYICRFPLYLRFYFALRLAFITTGDIVFRSKFEGPHRQWQLLATFTSTV